MMLQKKISLCTAVLWMAASAQAQQVCQPNIRETTPIAQFVVDSVAGTVLDTRTGLMWKRCAEGRSGNHCEQDVFAVYTWQEALQAAAASRYAGYPDWRLPNAKELESLVEEKCRLPSINLAVFPNEPGDWYWSSSPFSQYDDYAWRVSFEEGDAYYNVRHSQLAVRLVRDARTP
ncbi:MAG: Lcl C-terminal domain-containing protein [Gammaproteobacteria bacterium]